MSSPNTKKKLARFVSFDLKNVAISCILKKNIEDDFVMIMFKLTPKAMKLMSLDRLEIYCDDEKMFFEHRDNVIFVHVPDHHIRTVQLIEPGKYRSNKILTKSGDTYVVETQFAVWNIWFWINFCGMLGLLYLLKYVWIQIGIVKSFMIYCAWLWLTYRLFMTINLIKFEVANV